MKDKEQDVFAQANAPTTMSGSAKYTAITVNGIQTAGAEDVKTGRLWPS